MTDLSDTASGAVTSADRLLRRELAGGPRPASELRQAAADAGIGWRALQGAAERLTARRVKSGMSGGWVWSMPLEGAPEGAAGSSAMVTTCLQAYGFAVPSEALVGALYSTPIRD